MKASTSIELPEHFRTAKKLLDVFEGVCQRSLARLGKYRPPCTVVACKLLGSPKRGSVDPGDVHALRCEDGSVTEHLLTAHIKEHKYVCCAYEGAWEAARRGKLGFKHFVVKDLSLDAPSGGTRAHLARGNAPGLLRLA